MTPRNTPTKGHATTLADELNMTQATTPKPPLFHTAKARTVASALGLQGLWLAAHCAMAAITPVPPGWEFITYMLGALWVFFTSVALVIVAGAWIESGE